MPFVAMLGEKRIVSLELDDVQWDALRGQPLTMPGCGVRATRKRSHLGTRFFAHFKVSECTTVHKPESRQHRALKAAVYLLVGQTPGWQAVLEFPGPDRRWVADVMAIGPNGQHVAYEVQLSKQSNSAWEDRSQAYFDAGVLPVWVTPHTGGFEFIDVPHVTTSINTEASIPVDPVELLYEKVWHAPDGMKRSLGYRLQAFLRDGYAWELGTPAEQRAWRAAKDLERAEREELARLESERLEAERKAKEAAVRAEQDDKLRRFTQSATAVAASPVPAVGDAWGTCVACSFCGERSVVWTCGRGGAFAVSFEPAIGRAERTPWALETIPKWLAGSEYTAALMSFGASDVRRQRPGFFCPFCKHHIPQKMIARIPVGQWSRAGESTGQRPRPVLPGSRPVHPRPEHGARPAPRRNHPASSQEPAPSRLPVWEEETSPEEILQRQRAQAARAAEKLAIASNPQYVLVSGDWRYRCTVCGTEFDDMREGRHRGGACARH